MEARSEDQLKSPVLLCKDLFWLCWASTCEEKSSVVEEEEEALELVVLVSTVVEGAWVDEVVGSWDDDVVDVGEFVVDTSTTLL